MATIDTSKTYLLTNSFNGPSKPLAVLSGSTSLSIADLITTGSASTQQWFFTEAELTGFYRIHVVSLGTSQSLDVINDNGYNSTTVWMTGTGGYTGQYWRFDLWDSSDSGGGYRLSNNFTGLGMHLDVGSATLEAFLSDGDRTGQHWTLGSPSAAAATPTNPTPSASVVNLGPTTVTATSVSTTTVNSSSSSTSQPSSGGGKSSLPLGAIVGIAVGGVVIVVILALLAFFCLKKRRNGGGAGTQGGVEAAPVEIFQDYPKTEPVEVPAYKENIYEQAKPVSELDGGRVHQPLLVELP
ncbi:hypothetical protein TWF694_006711 [Orbilia ellipsospora]|uniref:Ricin B lectin domain-containing protein n=1 Tax=Orbilia ellipsospora TaxID=2528407 RepID=A0AAV9XKX2_9PEZI